VAPVTASLDEWRGVRAEWDARRLSVGFVPTMGALHEGHLSLLRRARAENDRVVLSVFVNPTQFDDPCDLERYPRALDEDVRLAGGLADHVLSPDPGEMYPDRYSFRVTERDRSATLEGAHRPGHFDGVLTVVLKLLNVVRPHRAYFGEKDRQQLELVRGMVRALLLPVEVVACPTVREEDGLAMSSRNRRLADGERRRAADFPRILREAPDAGAAAGALRVAGFGVDYVEDREGVRLAAVRIGDVRLIDNVRL
jgi:pantoate--beta-alanine ligase